MERTEGALVSRVAPSGPAARAGLKTGDVIVSFAGRPVDTATALIEAVKNARPGRKVTLRILRLGKKKTLRITPVLTP
jgi:serine protease Do